MTTHRPTYTTLITPAQLAALGDAQLAIIDCRHDLARPAWGAGAYREGHIPGALFASLDSDLSGPVDPGSGRHPLPAPQVLQASFGRWGIGEDVQVIAYDERQGSIAARLWWLLRFYGHRAVAVLDGGLAAWRAAGLPLSSEAVGRPQRIFNGHPEPQRVLGVDELQEGLRRGSVLLIDARTADRFAGRNETLDPVAGHVPGARNHPFTSNLDPQGHWLPAARLRELWRASLGDTPPSAVVSMCGSGVTACHNLLALEIAGMPGARLYAGSWSEWIRDPARPVTRD